jgi:hypothetical protein
MSHLSWKKNRDTGGVTCMESYVGNTPPNERFSLWDVCFMCFFGAAAKRYASTGLKLLSGGMVLPMLGRNQPPWVEGLLVALLLSRCCVLGGSKFHLLRSIIARNKAISRCFF